MVMNKSFKNKNHKRNHKNKNKSILGLRRITIVRENPAFLSFGTRNNSKDNIFEQDYIL